MGGQAPSLPTAPQDPIRTCGVQRQPQLIGVHGPGGVLVELVKRGLDQETAVSSPNPQLPGKGASEAGQPPSHPGCGPEIHGIATPFASL